MFDLLGGNPTIAGFSKARHCVAVSKVSLAVNAIILTDLWSKLRMLPISVNALRKSYPLQVYIMHT